MTASIDGSHEYRTPLPAETRTYQLTGYSPTDPAGRFQASDLVEPNPANPKKFLSVFDNEILHEQQPGTGRERRLIEHGRTFYRKNDLSALLNLTELETQAIPGENYKLAFTPGLLTQVFQRSGAALLPTPTVVLAGGGGDRGGYVDLDGDGQWWAPSGRSFFSAGTNDLAAKELAAFARRTSSSPPAATRSTPTRLPPTM